MRSLCSIQTIKELLPIEGKDRILLAEFKSIGFKCIVDLSYSVGQSVVYCEYDTILPAGNEAFEFLRKRCYSPKYDGFRITAMKMAGVLSEGIVFHTDILEKSLGMQVIPSLTDNFDVTKFIGAVKYDPETLEEREQNPIKHNWLMTKLLRFKWIKNIFYPPKLKGPWPVFFPGKTDETRIQSLPDVFSKLLAEEVYATEKMDGTSFSYSFYKGKEYVCSRNQWYKTESGGNYWEIAKKLDLKKKFKSYKENLVIQGEICGPSIQKNKYGFTEKRLFIFNIWSIDEKRYLNLGEMKECVRQLGLELVPHLSTFYFQFKDTDEAVEFAKGYSYFGDQVHREGVVIRPINPKSAMSGMSNMLSFKVINPDFIVKWGLG